jgi:hypothetical protein
MKIPTYGLVFFFAFAGSVPKKERQVLALAIRWHP